MRKVNVKEKSGHLAKIKNSYLENPRFATPLSMDTQQAFRICCSTSVEGVFTEPEKLPREVLEKAQKQREW